ncbi:MAG: FecR domain-containing protein [Kiritimatiellae bacterium]|nr:FecR domain-containing protein [Kiritimatiellia bacterium]
MTDPYAENRWLGRKKAVEGMLLTQFGQRVDPVAMIGRFRADLRQGRGQDAPSAWRRLVLPLAAAAMVLIGLGLLVLWPNRGARPGAGPALTAVQGRVEIRRGNRSVPGDTGGALRPGDRIETGADGRATLQFAGEATVLDLDGTSRITFDGDREGKAFTVAQGRVRAQVARQPAGRPLVLSSSLALAIVRGTTLEFRVSPDMTRLDVSDGRVEFRRPHRSETLEVASSGYAMVCPGLLLSANARRTDGAAEAGRVIDDFETPLAWRQSEYSAPLEFGRSVQAHGGANGLRVAFVPKPGDEHGYGAIVRPLNLAPGDRVLRFDINVEHYEGNADWNLQARLRDRTCWHLGGGLFRELRPGWNRVELEMPKRPVNAYGGGLYRPAEVRDLILSVCQRQATFIIDDIVVTK